VDLSYNRHFIGRSRSHELYKQIEVARGESDDQDYQSGNIDPWPAASRFILAFSRGRQAGIALSVDRQDAGTGIRTGDMVRIFVLSSPPSPTEWDWIFPFANLIVQAHDGRRRASGLIPSGSIVFRSVAKRRIGRTMTIPAQEGQSMILVIDDGAPLPDTLKMLLRMRVCRQDPLLSPLTGRFFCLPRAQCQTATDQRTQSRRSKGHRRSRNDRPRAIAAKSMSRSLRGTDRRRRTCRRVGDFAEGDKPSNPYVWRAGREYRHRYTFARQGQSYWLNAGAAVTVSSRRKLSGGIFHIPIADLMISDRGAVHAIHEESR